MDLDDQVRRGCDWYGRGRRRRNDRGDGRRGGRRRNRAGRWGGRRRDRAGRGGDRWEFDDDDRDGTRRLR